MTLTCPDTLDQSYEIDEGTTLYYALVPSDPVASGNGFFCGRLEVENDGWIGIGFTSSGRMDGSQAVIGIPAQGTVLKYDLVSYDATPMSGDKQTLTGTSITEEEGKVIMGFTKMLIEDGEVPIIKDSENIFIYAAGNGGYLGPHTKRGNFVINL
jgi:hypothetical protein